MKGIFDGITTAQLDEYTANYASTLAAEHPDFAVLAGRIAVSNLQKQTSKVFSEAMEQLYRNTDPITGAPKPLIAEDVYNIVMKNKEVTCLDTFFNTFFLSAHRFGYHPQQGLRLLLFWVPHARTCLFTASQREDRRASSIHDYACCHRNS